MRDRPIGADRAGSASSLSSPHADRAAAGDAGGLDRRRALGLAAGLAPALILPRGPAHARDRGGPGEGPPSAYKLHPDYRDDWVLQRTDPGAGITQLPNGVELFSGGDDASLPVVGRGVALWARTQVFGDFRAMFRYTRTDALRATTTSGSSTLFYWSTVGEGSAAWPADVSAWTGFDQKTAPVEDPTYIAHADGIRVSFNTFNSPNPALSDQTRIVAFRNGVSTRLLADQPRAIPFPTGERVKVTLIRQGMFFTFRAEPEDGPAAENRFTSSLIASYTGGWIGFRLQPGRRARIENFVMLAKGKDGGDAAVAGRHGTRTVAGRR